MKNLKSEWISVLDQHPDSDITVLIAMPGDDEQVWPGYLDREDGWRTVDGMTVENVSHWMHLPEPPIKRQAVKTSDGVDIVPGMMIYCAEDLGRSVNFMEFKVTVVGNLGIDCGEVIIPIRRPGIFSTRLLAENAVEKALGAQLGATSLDSAEKRAE